MKRNMAEAIGLKARALKHCDKIIGIINKQGRTEILLGNTGVGLPVEKNDAIYTLLQSIRFKLVHEINSIEIVSKMKPERRMLPAPYGACDETSAEQTCSICGSTIVKVNSRQKYCKSCAEKMRAEYQRQYRAKRAEKKA